jgi:hypothetical protein
MPARPIRPIPSLSVDQEGRFWDKVNREDSPDGLDGCWWWTATHCHGYGQFAIAGQKYYAHRIAVSLAFGMDPGPNPLDHLCDNGALGCVNPLHVVPTTQGENALRAANGTCAANARKTHCCRGHAFDEANTASGRNPNGRPKRTCRQCRAIWAANARLRRAQIG